MRWYNGICIRTNINVKTSKNSLINARYEFFYEEPIKDNNGFIQRKMLKVRNLKNMSDLS